MRCYNPLNLGFHSSSTRFSIRHTLLTFSPLQPPNLCLIRPPIDRIRGNRSQATDVHHHPSLFFSLMAIHKVLLLS